MNNNELRREAYAEIVRIMFEKKKWYVPRRVWLYGYIDARNMLKDLVDTDEIMKTFE